VQFFPVLKMISQADAFVINSQSCQN
jgi:hypothetical protein